MPAALQAKLLHVLQDQSFTKLGSNRPIEADVRVIAATNRDLDVMMRAGTFREDLYYRLQVIEIRIPALRERQEEILPLVEFFLTKYARTYHRPMVRPSAELRALLRRYSWPGNIRELENMMKRFVVLQDEQLILSELEACVERAAQPASVFAPAAGLTAASAAPTGTAAEVAVPSVLPASGTATATASAPAVEADAPASTEDTPGEAPLGQGLLGIARAAALKAERQAILEALTKFRWNRRKVADHLDVSYKTLLTKMKECGISEGADA
jgi:two-component system response regulator AtoC